MPTSTPGETPPGFWMDVAAAVRRELPPTMMGLFASTPTAPVQGVLYGDGLVLECANSFVAQTVDRPEVLSVVATKASAKLGKKIRVKVIDRTAKPKNTAQMEQLLDFGRIHNDIVKIKE
jgi:hypothetical protein